MRARLILIAATWTVVVGLAVGSAHAQAPTQPGGQFSLVGVVMLEGGRDLAFIQEPGSANNKVLIVRLGDNVGPYRVTKILTHQVELTGPAGTVVIPLAGEPGAVVVASTPGSVQPPAAGAQPEANTPPSLPNVVIPRGDPRREFPASALLMGAGAVTTVPEAQWSQSSQGQASQAGAPQRQSASTQAASGAAAAQQPVSPGQNVVLSRGDPRRDFPAAQLLIGAR